MEMSELLNMSSPSSPSKSRIKEENEWIGLSESNEKRVQKCH